ncbi:MAG: sugar ABC transporter substrate-binding protein [Chloroflexi bacterium]|nr:sugar ABC transporter substrate-binding protein [Chloroflexota bacterium]MCC6891649.1 sugar ABC transporter substrate-binding protein [Anaerolineae bacterium]
MKKSWIVLVSLFVIVLAVAAQVAAQDATSELSGVVRVGSWEADDALTPWNNAIAAFEAENPGVDIQLEAVPQDYGTKLLAQFAAGTAPDIFMSGDGDIAKWQSLGQTEDLAPYIAGENGFDTSVLVPGLSTFGDVAGSTYYLTKDYSPLVLYYNTDQFAEAGIELPTADWTWADFIAAAQALTVDANGNNATSADFDPTTITRWGVQIPDGWGDWLWSRGILPIIYANGGSLIAEDGSTTTGYMNSEATINALQEYVDIFKVQHIAPTKDDVAAYSGVDMFQSGLVSMLWTGVWPLNGYKDVEGLNFGTAGLPAGSEGKANVLCWSGFAMNSASQNKDAAWAFLKYIATGDGAKEFANYGLTAVQSVLDEQGLSTDEFHGPVIEDLANVKTLPEATTPFWADCGNKAFTDQMETVFVGDVAVADAMNAAAEQADTCLAEKAAEGS